ncbi:MAG: tetratricopeptide repeat protein, partial [Trichodesmium sp.]
MKKESPEISLRLAKEKASRGFLYQKQGKLETAISLYQKALNLVENLQFVHYNLGIIFHAQGNLLAASTYYQQEIAYYPHHIQAHYNLALIYQEQGLLDQAISSYQTVINLSQNNTENLTIQIQADRGWASILVESGRYKEAIEIIEQAIDLKPDDASLYNNLGQAFFHLGKMEKAIVNYQHALTLNPQLIVASYNLGKAYQQQNLHLEAIVHFQEVIKQQPENLSAYSECGFSYLELGDLAAAIPYLQKVVENSDFVESYCKQTDLLTESDQLQKAKISCSQFLLTLQKSDLAAVSKNLTLTYIYLGNVLFEYSEFTQAENYYRKGLKLQPLNIELYLKLGNSLAKQKRFNSAIIIYHLGLAIQPENYSINQALTKILADKNNSSKKLNADGITRILNLELETKTLSKTDNNIPNKCQGLNCQPCLKRIFKQLQPIHLGNGIHTFATRKKSTFSDSLSIDFPETPKFVTEVENGRAWIVPQKNDWMICNAIAIINQNNQLLAEVSREYPGQLPGCSKYDINNHRFLTTEKLPPLEQINGTVAVLSGLSGNVYFHWMVDILP